MPKAFSGYEREHIRRRLMEEARQCMVQYGMRKTTVDELVRRVNIPKGTFYLFYDSKELLFFDVFLAFHDEVQARLLSEIKAMEGNVDASGLTEVIFGLCKLVEGSFMLRFMTDGELELLIRKLPPEVAAKHAELDDFSVEQLLCLVPDMKAERVRVFSAALRGIFLAMLYKNEIGEEVFDEALRVMIRGVVTQMFEGESL